MKNSTETLVTCPTCNTPGFTPRGLKAHRCKGAKTSALSLHPSSFSSSEPGGSSDLKSGIIVAPGTLSRGAGVPPANDPTALADMTVPQLAEAGKALDRAGDLHENTAGICRLLHGLVLMEAKRKLAHGKFMPWVKKEFPNSHREASRRMKAAAVFLQTLTDKKQLKKLKLDRHVQFDAQRLLLGDLATNLTEISAAQLDMSNPVVQAASAYVGKRSWTQLVLDLGDLRENNGGKRKRPNGTKRPTKDEKEFDDKESACLAWYKAGLPLVRMLHLQAELTWLHLPDVELANIADLLKFAAKKAAEVCRARKVVPSKLSNWNTEEDAQ